MDQRLHGRRRYPALAVLLFVAALPLVSADEVSIAVAANFTEAARDLAARFEETTGHRARLSFGATGQFYAQISNGAPYEVFLAADVERPRKTESTGHAVNGSRFTYARGALMLVSDHTGKFKDGPAFLESGDYQRLAIANPETAPYGLAARQVLEKLGLWKQLQSRIVRGNSIAQTYQFVATSNADIGFVATSQVLAREAKDGTTFSSSWLVPATFHEPIEQQAVLLTRGANSEAANAYMAFLKSADARKIIARYGYSLPQAESAQR
jgi:molybdate transport system substrate-binding protein